MDLTVQGGQSPASYMESADDGPPLITRVPRKPKVAQFCAAPWPNFTPPLTITTHWDGILNAFDSRLTNGGVEAINGLIQVAKGRARGYRTTRNFINVAYLVAGDFTNLPASPYTTTSGPVVS